MQLDKVEFLPAMPEQTFLFSVSDKQNSSIATKKLYHK